MASIRKNKGRWQAVIRKKFHPTVTKSFLSKAEASRWAKDSELKIERGVFESLDEANRTKLKELLERYVLEVTPKKKGAIQEGFKIRKLMRSKIVDHSLAMITPTKIAKFRDELLSQVKPATVNKYLGLIQVSISHAKREWGLHLPTNPAESIKRLKEPEPSTERIEQWEYDLLVKNAERSKLHCLRHMIIFAMETGARRGEIMRLKINDINFNRSTCILRDTKNGSDRNIGIPKNVLDLLKTLPVGIDGRLFNTNSEQFKWYWNQLRRWTGYKKKFHLFRSEFATRCFENGWDISSVATQGGWKDWKVLRRYTKISGEFLAKKLNR